MFFVVLRTASLSVQGQRGGCTGKKRGGVPAPHSLNSFVSCGLPLIFGFENDDPEKCEETIATPPKGGFLLTPIAALSTVPLSRPVGGRYRRYLSLREGSEKTPRSGANETENGPMEFRLTYEGKLLSRANPTHVHDIRKKFHKQLKKLWAEHPVLNRGHSTSPVIPLPGTSMREIIHKNEFNWLPIVTKKNGLVCGLDILMLREGPPGRTITDIDNQLKTIFDALRMAGSSQELRTRNNGPQKPGDGEDTFFVLLEDDLLITHLSVTSDMLLDPLESTAEEGLQARLVITVSVRPYDVNSCNLDFA